mmetsp:Transcript_38236/g.51766  ORF Transcript_38236/g.51766 Transcript_38236/m.51766 type:complete len:165 (+) Transcript_38236:261-755(+)
MLTNNIVPNLGCLWNGAVQTSTIHPQAIVDAKRRHGIPVGEITEYFVIPVQRLLNDPDVKKMAHWNFPAMTPVRKLGFLFNMQQFGGFFGTWNVDDWPVLDQHYLDTTFENLSELTPFAEESYKEWGESYARGETPQVLTYQGLPHVFVLGEINIDGLDVIKVQ